MRLDWLTEIQKSSLEAEVVASQIISPITGQFYEGDSLLAHFIVYEENKPIENADIRDIQFQQGINDWIETTFTIIGEYKNQSFVVRYEEAEAMVLITVNDKLQSVLSLINANPESLSVDGVRLTKNKRAMVSTGDFANPKMRTETAEWYPLYVVENISDETATEISFILMLLFFAVGQTG